LRKAFVGLAAFTQSDRASVQQAQELAVRARRCNKRKEYYLGFVAIGAVKLWLPFVNEAWS
jgi:hypothetical protein